MLVGLGFLFSLVCAEVASDRQVNVSKGTGKKYLYFLLFRILLRTKGGHTNELCAESSKVRT